MLKIKDNVDLKELEKFGFQQGWRNQPLDPVPIVAIVDTKRKLKIQLSTNAWWNKDFYYLYDKNQDKVYDLIKAGLVEKVEDKENRL